jgi:hypothetical protein
MKQENLYKMILVDRTEIEGWGQKFDAKGNFPKLIAKLIRETTPKSTFLQVPSGSAVTIGGWDGIVKCEEKTSYVPKGISLWEIGTNGNKAKANIDYKKRTEDSLGFDKSEVTYIFITTNIWVDKNDWVKEKLKDNVWHDIKVYDSRDIAEWLENAPISCRWFAVLSSNHPYDGIYTADEYWKMLSYGPKGQLTPKTITSGRETESQVLLKFLSGKPSLLAVQGSTKEEAIAFIIASALQFDHHAKELFLSRSVVVDTENNFHGLRINKNSLNLIAKLDITGKLYVAIDNDHHVLVPVGPDDNFTSRDIIVLPRIDRNGQVEALQEMGLSREEAYKYSKESGRDYTILKNLLGFPPNDTRWKFHVNIEEIVPALLVGRWNETNDRDRKIVEKLSGENYDTYSEKLFKWLEVEAPPLIKIGEYWRLKSPLDAWTNLSGYISAKDFDNLRECFLNVMREINPVIELKPDQKLIASISGKELEFSGWCREGLTQSLILIGLHGDKLKFQHNFSSQHWVDAIIRELLYDAPGNLWASRNSEMPLIAEASPKSFFESAYLSLSRDDMPIMDMFIEEDSWLSPTSRHTGLLWALEGLAWTEDYLFDASMILARLASLDPGGKLLNRPLNSLMEIYNPWHYQTLASIKNRVAILEQIVKKEFETGWKLLISMIPSGYESASDTHKLRWRLFERSFDPKYKWDEIFDTHSMVIDLLIQYFDFSEDKLVVLLEKSESKQLKHSDRSKLLLFIESNLDKIIIKKNFAWHAIRGFLSKHRSHPDAEWALPEGELKRYEAIYKYLEPSDPIEKVLWMFNDNWPNSPEGIEKKELSYSEQEELVAKRRIESLKTIYQNFGFEKVKTLARSVKETWVYGDTLAHIIVEEDEILSLCEYLKEEEGPILQFIQRFVFIKSLCNNVQWVFDLYAKLKERKFTDNQLAALFIQIEQSKKVWDFIGETSVETQESYWERINPHFWGLPVEDRIFGIDKLIGIKRFISAADICYHETKDIPSDKLVEVLEKAGTQESNEERRFDSYHVTKLIEEIEAREDVDKSVLIKLEWLYLPLLASYGSPHKPSILHEELAKNPEFFIEVLRWVYKSDKNEEETEDISDETKRNRARNAYELLRSWKRMPGLDESGNIDEDFLWKWIDKVREIAEKIGRLKVADLKIGQVIAEYPEDIEPWPPKEICKVIESINTQNLKSGFSTATFNKRGSSTRGAFDGGDIERGHAEYFRSQADKIKYKFPATAEILIHLANGYEEEAKSMDERAERDKLDY